LNDPRGSPDFGTADVFIFKGDLHSPDTGTATVPQGMALILSEDGGEIDPDDMALFDGMMVYAGAQAAEGNLLILSEDFAMM